MKQISQVFPRQSVPLLGRTKPNRTLLVSSMRCEYIAAEIRNQTVDSMEREDIADLAYRYLQTRRGTSNCIKEALCWSSCAAMILVYGLIYRDSNRFLLSLSLVLCALHVPPNLGNAIRYAESQNGCEMWLSTRLPAKDVATIKAMRFEKAGMHALIAFFKASRTDITSIEHRTKKEDSFFSCWDMGR